MNAFELRTYVLVDVVATSSKLHREPSGTGCTGRGRGPLFEMLDKDFPGLSIGLVSAPSRHWLGAPVWTDDEDESSVVILDGSCGWAGCCGVTGRITISVDTVTWFDLVSLGPRLDVPIAFTFDRLTYEAAIHTVSAKEPFLWSPPVD